MYNVFYGGSKVVYIPSTSDTLLKLIIYTQTIVAGNILLPYSLIPSHY